MAKGAGRNLYRRGSTYWARVQIAGRDVRQSLRTSNRAEAVKRLETILKDAERIRFGEEARHKYEDAVVLWAESGFGGVKPRSAARYQTSLRMLHEHFSPLHLDQITARRIGEYVRNRRKDGATNATIRRDLSALSRCIAHANAHGWGEDNAAKNWDRSVIRERKFIMERVDEASLKAVLARCSPIFGAYVRFLLATGVRADEAATIKRAAVDWSGARCLVNGKTGLRTIELSANALAIAKAVPPSLSSPFLFWASHGGRFTAPSQRFTTARVSAQKAARKAEQPFKHFRLHDLRHEYAIRYLEAGGSLYALQKHLGHSSIKTTEHYCAFITPEQAERAKGPAQTTAQTQRIAALNLLAAKEESEDA
jgi:integrase/recombinase XerD